MYDRCRARRPARSAPIRRSWSRTVSRARWTGPRVRRAARVFAQRAAVITFSFRGHGGSGGRSTVGDREVLDLAAAVALGALPRAPPGGHGRLLDGRFRRAAARRAVYGARHDCRRGAAARHGSRARGAHGSARGRSGCGEAPARWYYRGTAPMRRLHWVVTRPAGRLVGRYGLAHPDPPREWDPVPLSPVESVAADRADPAADRARRPGPVLPARPPAHAGRRGRGARRAVAGAGHGPRGERGGRELAAPGSADWSVGARWSLALHGRRWTPRRRERRHGAAGTIRYWAAAKAAAGTAEEPYEAATLAEALDAARERHPGELARVLLRCSFLVDGDPVGTRSHETVRLAEGGTVEVLPPFAGG